MKNWSGNQMSDFNNTYRDFREKLCVPRVLRPDKLSFICVKATKMGLIFLMSAFCAIDWTHAGFAHFLPKIRKMTEKSF